MKISEQTRRLLLELGERIRQSRIESNLSQVELGERIGVTRYTVGALEGGRANVAIGTVFEAALAVGLPLPCQSDPHVRTATGNGNPPHIKLDDDYF